MPMVPRARVTLRRSLTAASLLALSLPVGAAPQVAPVVGFTREAGTGAPLPGVLVSLVSVPGGDTEATVLSDETGRFIMPGTVGREYRLHGERVGLSSVTSGIFRLEPETDIRELRMAEAAVQIEGLTVRRPIRLCEIGEADALLVQRWWNEIRKALESAAVVHANELDEFTFERFQREWTRNLSGLRAERYFAVDALDPRPFLSEDAQTLSDGGYVQGPRGERRFYAPDAGVLLSSTFLRDHCFGIQSTGESSSTLSLSIAPTDDRDVPDITGVLEIDTISKELRTFDFEYVNLPDDIPSSSAAGGHLRFEYLISGAWIVSEWWVRMPWVDPRVWPPTVLAYVDEGGRLTGAAAATLSDSGVVLAGTVFDSLHSRPLAEARVSVLGTRLASRTAADGSFELRSVPPGMRAITVHHEDLTALAIPSPVVRVEVQAAGTDPLRVFIPSFRSVAPLLCPEGEQPPSVILAGAVIDPARDSAGVASTAVRAQWLRAPEGGGAPVSVFEETLTDPDGRFVLCALPAESPVTLAVQSGTGWRAAGEASISDETVLGRTLVPGRALDAVVRGHVADAATGSDLSSSVVSVHGTTAGEPLAILADVTGEFRLVIPEAGDYVVRAAAGGFSPLTSSRLTVAAGDVVDLRFELQPRSASKALQGRVVDAASRVPIPDAGVHLLDRNGRPVARALTDSSGWYRLTVPGPDTRVLLAQSPGYLEEEITLPLQRAAEDPVHVELRSEAIELDPLTVSVRNNQVLDWLTHVMGANPAQFFGFRVIQGARLEAAKERGDLDPTEVLRWLYIPVWHGGACVSVNVSPGITREGFRGGRRSAFVPGAPSQGTVDIEATATEAGTDEDCGRLFVDERLIPNDQIASVVMDDIAVVTTLPGEVRMYTYDFEWAFR